jgi:hypothetical protein
VAEDRQISGGCPRCDTLVASHAAPSVQGHPRSIGHDETETSMYPQVTQFETRQRELRAPDASQTPSIGRKPTSSRPRRYKLALLTWGAAYTVITLILAVLGPAMASWPLGLRTFVLSVLMVVLLTWLIMPAVTRFFRVWLDEAR